MTGEALYNAWQDEFGSTDSRLRKPWMLLLGVEKDRWSRIANKFNERA